jgi:hypothetical protein
MTAEVERSIVIHGDAKTRASIEEPSYWFLLSRRVEGCPKCGGALITSENMFSPGMLVQECCRCSYTVMNGMNPSYGVPGVR